jgi:hypothetical protein
LGPRLPRAREREKQDEWYDRSRGAL